MIKLTPSDKALPNVPHRRSAILRWLRHRDDSVVRTLVGSTVTSATVTGDDDVTVKETATKVSFRFS